MTSIGVVTYIFLVCGNYFDRYFEVLDRLLVLPVTASTLISEKVFQYKRFVSLTRPFAVFSVVAISFVAASIVYYALSFHPMMSVVLSFTVGSFIHHRLVLNDFSAAARVAITWAASFIVLSCGLLAWDVSIRDYSNWLHWVALVVAVPTLIS